MVQAERIVVISGKLEVVVRVIRIFKVAGECCLMLDDSRNGLECLAGP